MDYVIQHDEERQIITVTATGKWEMEKDNEMIRQILKAVEESASKKVLVDIRELDFDLPMIHFYERAQGLRDQRLKVSTTSTRVALVYSARNKKIDEDVLFFETVARNRNLPYRVFKELEEARTWLCEPKSAV